MEVYNILEKIVWDNIDNVLDRNPDVCRCEKCRADMVAYALNKLPPHYVVSEQGAVIARALSLNDKFKIELLVAMTEAMKKICENPRHDQDKLNK